MNQTLRAICRLVLRSFLVALVFVSVVQAAELPTPEEIVAQAGKACAALNAGKEKSRQAGARERFERELRQRAWMRLALARVHLGDFDGAVEALNRVNSDPRFSQISVQAMRTELSGVVPPWPADLPPKLKETQKSVLAEILAKQGRFDAALEMAGELADEQARARSTAQALLARARSTEKTDHLASLKDQVRVTELANTIRDPHEVFGLFLEVCRGQIRIGPPQAARITIQAMAFKLQETEKESVRTDTVKEWMAFGELYLLVDDNQGAEQCFERVRKIFAKASPGQAWNGSLAHQLTLRYRCQAHRETRKLAQISNVLVEWEQAFAKLTDPSDMMSVAPYLISQEIQSDRFDEAATIIKALETSIRGIVVQAAADEIQRTASAMQKKRFAGFLKTLKENEVLQLSMLVVAAELFESAGDPESADASIVAALAISTELQKDYHSMIVGWLAENGRFARAYDLISSLDDPNDRAQALSELAYQMTKPRK